jgi:hypothetical protein
VAASCLLLPCCALCCMLVAGCSLHACVPAALHPGHAAATRGALGWLRGDRKCTCSLTAACPAHTSIHGMPAINHTCCCCHHRCVVGCQSALGHNPVTRSRRPVRGALKPAVQVSAGLHWLPAACCCLAVHCAACLWLAAACMAVCQLHFTQAMPQPPAGPSGGCEVIANAQAASQQPAQLTQASMVCLLSISHAAAATTGVS